MSAVTLAEALTDPLAVWLTSVTWPSPVVSEWRHPFAPMSEARAKGVDVWLPGGLGFSMRMSGDDIPYVIVPDHADTAFASVDWGNYDIHTFEKLEYAKWTTWFIFWGRKNGHRLRLWLPIGPDLADFLKAENPPEIVLRETKLTRWEF